MWCLSEINDNGINNVYNINFNINKQESTNEKQGRGKIMLILVKIIEIEISNLNNICEEEPKISICRVEIANIHKKHFLLDSQNVYVFILYIY